MTPESTVRNWWRDLQLTRPDGTSNHRSDRASLARLRRASSPSESLAEPSVLALYKSLGFSRGEVGERLPWLAAAAMVLAHVRADDPSRTVARAIGRAKFETPAEEAPMKPLRFRRLLAARDCDDVARQMRRLVGLTGDRTVNVGDLALAILDWQHPVRGDRIRTRWAYDYYAAPDAAPDTNAG